MVEVGGGCGGREEATSTRGRRAGPPRRRVPGAARRPRRVGGEAGSHERPPERRIPATGGLGRPWCGPAGRRRAATRGGEGPPGAGESVPHHLPPAGEPGKAAGYHRPRAQTRGGGHIAAVAGVGIRNLKKQFGGLWAGDGGDLSIRGGGVLGLVGPPGGGKTTLLPPIPGPQRPPRGGIPI